MRIATATRPKASTCSEKMLHYGRQMHAGVSMTSLRNLASAIGFVLIAAIGSWLYLALRELPDRHAFPSPTVAESKALGRYVMSVRMTPPTMLADGCEIEFDEAWIERAMKRERSFLGIVQDAPIGCYFLCFTIKRGRECLEHLDIPSRFNFVLNSQGSGFASLNTTEIFWTDILDSGS